MIKAAGLALALTGAAVAWTPARAAPVTEPHTHNGPFLRLGTGPAFMYERWSPDGGGPSAGVYGWGPSIEIAAGRTVVPGVVLAASLQLSGIFDRTESFRGASYTLGDTLHLVDTLTALVDYYPDPWCGLHFGGGVGIVAVTEQDTYIGGHQTGWGVTGAAHIGKEVFFSNRWSIGALARLQIYRYGSTDATASTSLGFVPTVMLAFTYD
jgi:hypothetical protein